MLLYNSYPNQLLLQYIGYSLPLNKGFLYTPPHRVIINLIYRYEIKDIFGAIFYTQGEYIYSVIIFIMLITFI